MTMSLLNDSAAENEHPARPKCSRCRHHGIIVPKKDHTKICPFLNCECWKCYLITQRTKITALQREMTRAKKEPRPRASPGARRVNKQGEEAFGTPTPDGGAPSTSAPMCPRPGETPERGTPADPWRRPEPGGQPVSGLDSRDLLPSASGKCAPLNSPCFSDFRQMAPLPLIHFPFRMPGYYPSSYSSPHFLPNMPWLPPVPVEFYKDGLCGHLMFPHLQQGAVNYPPPPEPGPPADYRQVFFTHHPLRDSETFEEELMSRQHPPPPVPGTTEQDSAQQVNRGNEL